MKRWLQFLIFLTILFSLGLAHAQNLSEQYGHPRVTAMALSPDNTKVAIGLAPDSCLPFDVPDEDLEHSAIRILDVQTGEQVQSIAFPNCQIVDLDWNSTGTQFAYSTFGQEGGVIVDLVQGPIIGLTKYGGMGGPSSSGVEWSPNDQYVIEYSYDLSRINILDAANGLLLSSIKEQVIGENVTDADWSPDGNYIAIADIGSIEIWDVRTITSPQLVAEYRQDSNSVDWSSDGQHLLLATSNVIVIDAYTGEILQTFDDIGRAIVDAQWSPNNQYVGTASTDSKIRVWDVVTETLIDERVISGLLYPIFDWKSDSSQVIYMQEIYGDNTGTVTVSVIDVFPASSTISPLTPLPRATP